MMTDEQKRILALVAARKRLKAKADPSRAYMEARSRGEMPAPVPMNAQRVAEQTQTDATMMRGVADAADNAAKPSLGLDLLASAGSGVSRGVTGLLDLPRTVGGLAQIGAQKIVGDNFAENFGAGMKAGLGPLGSIDDLMGGQSFTQAADRATGGYLSYEPQTTAGDYTQTVGEFAPAALLGGLGIVRGILAPALASETAGQLTEGTAAEPYARIAGAVAGPAMVGGIERLGRNLISPNSGADAARLRMAKQLEDAGIPITAGQRVGNESLRRQEALTGAGQRIAGTQNEALTRAALKSVGVTADRATPDVLNRAARSIGKVFDDVLGNVDVMPSAPITQKIAQVVDDYRLNAPANDAVPLVREIAKRVKAGQTIPAQTVAKWRSSLSKATTSPNAATREAAIDMLDAVDDMIADGLRAAGREADLARLATARQQYRNFLAVQKAAGAANSGDGVLTAAQLRNAVASQGRAAYAQGRRGELAELARAGRVVMDPLPNSGTAQNLSAMGVPMVTQGGAGAYLGSMVGGPVGAGVGSVVGAAAPYAVRAAKMTPLGQRYLSNQLVAPYAAPTNAPYSKAFLNALAQNGGN